MARKLRIGEAPTGIPKHTVKVNNKNVGLMEDHVSVKAYGRAVYFNDRHVCDATSDVIYVTVPKGVRIKGARASQGVTLHVGH